MQFCCKLSAVSASLAVKDFCKSANIRRKYIDRVWRHTFDSLHFRNVKSLSRFETSAENSWLLTSDVVS